MNNIREESRQRFLRSKNWTDIRERREEKEAKGGQIGVHETRTENVVEEPKTSRNVLLSSEKIKVDEKSSVKEEKYAFQRNPCLDGHPREEGLENCVVKNAAVTSNKSEIARRCNCSPRTVYRILVEEDKERYVELEEVEICEQCGKTFVGCEVEDGAVVCSNCGWERE